LTQQPAMSLGLLEEVWLQPFLIFCSMREMSRHCHWHAVETPVLFGMEAWRAPGPVRMRQLAEKSLSFT